MKVLGRTPAMFHALVVLSGACTISCLASDTLPVTVTTRADLGRVEVRIGDGLFTAYCYGPEFRQKPVLYPLLSPGGNPVNRELPFIDEATPETRDHPHQQSLFFGYGDVNGLDFWSHAHGEHMVHRSLIRAESGAASGVIEILADWVDGADKTVLQEHRFMRFGGDSRRRWIDFQAWLVSLADALTFHDTKEGFFALRLADALREGDGTGRYRNAFGRESEAQIWGRRSPWVALTGVVNGERVTVAIFELPDSLRHPTYWHARAYGLFAANPLGRKDFAPGREPIELRVQPGESLHFHYRVVVYTGEVEPLALDEDYQDVIR